MSTWTAVSTLALSRGLATRAAGGRSRRSGGVTAAPLATAARHAGGVGACVVLAWRARRRPSARHLRLTEAHRGAVVRLGAATKASAGAAGAPEVRSCERGMGRRARGGAC